MRKIFFACFCFAVLCVFFALGAAPRGIVETRGGKVKAVKFADGSWQLLVDDKPYFIKGVVFSPVKIGESPMESTMRDWMYYDDNHDGINDIAFQTWVDRNGNNARDAGEEISGDFKLLKEMGCNTIRLYHVPSDNPLLGNIYQTNPSIKLQFDHAVNKKLLRRLYREYGIMVIMGNFLGSWTIGSGASWEEGTDYTNLAHRENIKKSVKAMVLDNRDEPYVLMWLLGNENNIADWSQCNAKKEPRAYATLIGELARMIHQLDPKHPVAVCDGDIFNTVPLYARYAPEIDILAFNSYRGKNGFGDLWRTSKRLFDRPVFISEFGVPAQDIEGGEDGQKEYIENCWRDIVSNGVGNSIGGVVYDWIDRWYMAGSPGEHTACVPNEKAADQRCREEWFGIMGMGDGSDWLLRQPRKAYYLLKQLWNKNSPAY